MMTPLVMSAYTVVTALGQGLSATLDALRGRRSGLRPCNFEDAAIKTYVGQVEGVDSFTLSHELERFDCRNNRLAWLGLQQDGFTVAAAQAKKRYGAHRVAVILGTSTSGILETGNMPIPAAIPRQAPYLIGMPLDTVTPTICSR